jgi:hypothetical protein
MATRASHAAQATPRVGPGRLRWNGGGWAGSVLGMSFWLVLASGLALAEADFVRAAALAGCAALVLVTGVALWRARAQLAPLPAALALVAATLVAAAVALPLLSGVPDTARVQGPLEGWPWWLAIFPALAVLLVWVDRRGQPS